MLIKIEDLHPKNLINFYLPKPLVKPNSAEIFTSQKMKQPQIVSNILAIDGVEQCLLTDVLMSVRFTDSAVREDVQALVLAELDDYLNDSGYQVLQTTQTPASLELLEALADSFIRPTLNRDKGDIKIISYVNNCLELQFTGHCAGCPYAQNTLNNVIASCFNRYVPTLKEIKIKE